MSTWDPLTAIRYTGGSTGALHGFVPPAQYPETAAHDDTGSEGFYLAGSGCSPAGGCPRAQVRQVGLSRDFWPAGSGSSGLGCVAMGFLLYFFW